MGGGGGGTMLKGGAVGDQRTVIVSALLSPCSVVLTTKSKKWKLWERIQGKVDPKKSSQGG